MNENQNHENERVDIDALLSNATTIAVVGASANRFRDSNRITRYLIDAGYDVYPVNPHHDEVEGRKSWPNLASLPVHIDIVDVFRREEALPGVIDEAIAAGAGAVWLQLGLTSPEAEERARQAGLAVVADHCIAVEHRLRGIRRESTT